MLAPLKMTCALVCQKILPKFFTEARNVEFEWLKKVSTCSFFKHADKIIYIFFPAMGRYGAFRA